MDVPAHILTNNGPRSRRGSAVDFSEMVERNAKRGCHPLDQTDAERDVREAGVGFRSRISTQRCAITSHENVSANLREVSYEPAIQV